MAQRWENRLASIGGHLKRMEIFQKLGMNRDFDFDVRFILDKRERSFHEVYILPFEPPEIAQAGSGEVPREDHSAPFPIGAGSQEPEKIAHNPDV